MLKKRTWLTTNMWVCSILSKELYFRKNSRYFLQVYLFAQPYIMPPTYPELSWLTSRTDNEVVICPDAAHARLVRASCNLSMCRPVTWLVDLNSIRFGSWREDYVAQHMAWIHVLGPRLNLAMNLGAVIHFTDYDGRNMRPSCKHSSYMWNVSADGSIWRND